VLSKNADRKVSRIAPRATVRLALQGHTGVPDNERLGCREAEKIAWSLAFLELQTEAANLGTV